MFNAARIRTATRLLAAFAILLVSILPVQAWSPNDPMEPQFTEAEKAGQRNAGTNLLAALRNAAANYQSSFTIPPGDYRFSAGSGSYPVLTGIRDMVITATGATFWFDPPHTWGLEFNSCRNVQVLGLTMDCDPHPHSQGVITAINSTSSTADMVVMDGYRMPTEGERRATIFYRPDGSFIMRGHTTGEVTLLGGRTVRVAVDLSGVSVGDYMVLSQRTGQFLRVLNCEQMLFQDVNLWSGGGMAVLESGGAGSNVYRRLKATRRPGTNRLHAFGADGFHMKNTEIGPTIDQCEVSHTSDDLINIHGYFGWVASRMDARRFRVLGSDSPFYVGQKLNFWSEVSVAPRTSARITQVTQVTDATQVAAAKVGMPSNWSADVFDITLDADVDAQPTDLIEHHNKVCAGFVVKDSYFHDCFNRAFLINGSPNGLVKGNTFARIKSGGISVAMETWSYMEGQFPHGTVIEGNNLIAMPGISVSMNPKGPAGPHRFRPIKDLTIRGNYVEGTIKVMHTDTAQILDNRLLMNIPAGWTRPVVSEDFYGSSYGDAIQLSVVANANVSGNTVTWTNPAGDDVRIGPLVQNVRVGGVQKPEPIADFNTGWFISGIQGDASWFYGTADGALVRSGQYQASHFQQFPVYDGNWRITGGAVPFCGKYDMHPDPTRAVVRRWVSTVTAPLRANGRVQTSSTSGNQTVARIYVGGVLKWSQDNSGSRVNAFDVDLGTVNAGTPVDFVVDSKGESSNDTTQMSAMILQPATPATPPGSPSGLTGATRDWQTLELRWERSPSTVTYNVKRSTSSGGPFTTIATGITGTEFTDSALTPGGSYYYVVSGVNWLGESADSAEFHWSSAPAGSMTKLDNANALSYGTSWSSGTAPGAFNVAVWGSSALAAASRGAPLGADVSWSGMQVQSPGGGVTIPAGNTLTLGPGGLAASGNDVSFPGTVVIGASQMWALGNSRSVSITGALKGSNVILTITGSSGSFMNLTGSAAGFAGTLNYGAAARLRLRASFEGTQTALNVTSSASVSAEGTIGTVRIGDLATASSLAALGNNDQNGAVTYAVGFLGKNSTWAGLIRNGRSDFAIATSIHKVGAGTWTLTGSNTYTGATTVGGGTLRVNNSAGSGTGAGAVTVHAGATLSGTGIISGPIAVQSGATLIPGSGGSGTLTVNNTVMLAGTTRMNLNRLNTPNATRLVGVSTLTCGGALEIKNSGPALQAGDTFHLFAANNIIGEFSSLTLPSLGSGLVWKIDELGTTGVVSVTTTFESWRESQFTAVQLTNSSICGPAADPDHDGIVNLLEFFLASAPLVHNAASSLPIAVRNGATLEYRYTRSIAAMSQLKFAVEWSDTLGNDWSAVGITEQVLTDNGSVQQVKASLPAGSSGRRFVQLRVQLEGER